MSVPEEGRSYGQENVPIDLRALFHAFQMAFSDHIKSKNFPVLIESAEGVEIGLVDAGLSYMLATGAARMNGVVPIVNPDEISTWTFHEGMLASACRAAKQLQGEYDFAIGIAKKGLWSSFVFSLMGIPTKDAVVVRDKEWRRMFPMDEITTSIVSGKKILLLDNDAVTGRTISTVLDELDGAGARQVDVLLIHRYSHLETAFFEQIKDSLAPEQHIGKAKTGKQVIDTFSSLPAKIKRKMALETDFRGRNKDLQELRRRLHV